MTHADFKTLALGAGADIVFSTSRIAVFVDATTELTLTVEVPGDAPLNHTQVLSALIQAGAVTGKVVKVHV